jgi:hypothetical protein
MTRIQLPALDSLSDEEHDKAMDELVQALWAERRTAGPEIDGEPSKDLIPSDGPWDD